MTKHMTQLYSVRVEFVDQSVNPLCIKIATYWEFRDGMLTIKEGKHDLVKINADKILVFHSSEYREVKEKKE